MSHPHEGEHIHPTIYMSVTEQMLIFLHIIGHNVRFRVISSQFHKSIETVHRYFKVVLRGVLKLYKALIRLPSEDTPPKIRDSRKFSDRPPKNERELFNLRHSSLRTTIERGFGLPPMHTTMLIVLAEEAVKGNKPSNTFKSGSFATVAKEISDQFGVKCHPSYVENRMCTLRTMWSTIQTLRKKSGFGWDNNLKMITCDTHRKHAEFLNKRIEMYDELAIVVGKDMATSSFAKSYVDIDTEQEHGESTKMAANNGEKGVLKEITVALKEINRGPVDYTSLYSEVMAMAANGYSEDMLATAFDHLCENKKAARGFLAKNAKLRKLWMGSYLFTRV
ncbi:hypothetical protein ACB092_01G078100 [Castanea dentata]